MKKNWSRVFVWFVFSMALVFASGCNGDHRSPTAPGDSSVATTVDPYANLTVVDIQRPQGGNNIALFIYGNLSATLGKSFDANGANITVRERSSGKVKNWTAPYGNTVVGNNPGTIIRDITTNGSVLVGFRIEPYGWKTPADFLWFNFGNKDNFVTFPKSMNYQVVSADPEWDIKGGLPPVNNASLTSMTESGSDESWLRSQWVPRISEVAPARLTSVESLDGRVLCIDRGGTGACEAYRER